MVEMVEKVETSKSYQYGKHELGSAWPYSDASERITNRKTSDERLCCALEKGLCNL